ncbi:MAG: murein L,D-transpeptidase [Terrabacter sp.]|nr:murein L,D-transpeptidase [Terrabacter sp.]
MDRNRTVGSVAATLAVIALAVTAPAARADDLTGTPTPPGTSTSTGSTGSTAGSTVADATTTSSTTTTTTTTMTTPSTTSTTTTSSPTTTTPPPPAPSPVVIPAGSSGWKVKDLQVRLRLVKASYWTYAVSGSYGWTLGQKVLAFQTDQSLPRTGVVDQRTWSRLVALTATTTRLAEGSTGYAVKDLQSRLRAVRTSYWSYAVSGYYGWTLGQKVLTFQRDQNLPQSGVAFQRAYDVPQSGAVDSRTWARLRALTYTPGTFDQHRFYAGLRPLVPTLASLDQRCRTGRVMCVDKSTRTLTWVVNGKPLTSMWARFGRPGKETREGTFSVSRKYEYVISNLYFTPMPYSMFFSGGQAVHYSSNFARLGYASASHGCVNIADHAQVKALFFAVRIGDKVVVYP